MNPALHFISQNAHDVSVGERRVLFHIPTSSLFDLDDITGDIYDFFKRKNHRE